jgi:transposase
MIMRPGRAAPLLQTEADYPMDPFYVVRLAGDAWDSCRRRVQQQTCGHRGRARDPLYSARRTLHTGADLLTGKQRTRLEILFTSEPMLRSKQAGAPTSAWLPTIGNQTVPKAGR